MDWTRLQCFGHRMHLANGKLMNTSEKKGLCPNAHSEDLRHIVIDFTRHILHQCLRLSPFVHYPKYIIKLENGLSRAQTPAKEAVHREKMVN